MRQFFSPIDDALIERVFQPLVDLAAERLGFTRTAVTCFCLDMASLAWIVSRAGELSGPRTWSNTATASMDIGLLGLGLIALMSLRCLFSRTGRQRQGNPLRQAMQPHRAVVLLLLWVRLLQYQVPELADTAEVLMLLFSAAALYLGACAERPPVRRRSWIRLPAANAR